jgi:hypothetical protein
MHREVYYVAARIYDETQQLNHREVCSYYYNVATEFLNYSSETKEIALYNAVDESIIGHFEDTLDQLKTLFKLVEPVSTISKVSA